MTPICPVCFRHMYASACARVSARALHLCDGHALVAAATIRSLGKARRATKEAMAWQAWATNQANVWAFFCAWPTYASSSMSASSRPAAVGMSCGTPSKSERHATWHQMYNIHAMMVGM